MNLYFRRSKTNARADESNPFGDDSEDEASNDKHSNSNNNNNRNSTTNNNTEKYLNVKVRAVYDYHSTEDDELTFKAGNTWSNWNLRVFMLLKRVSFLFIYRRRIYKIAESRWPWLVFRQIEWSHRLIPSNICAWNMRKRLVCTCIYLSFD